jgi:hypothetical protein
VIEEFFKALKTGCAFETRQLESMHTLDNALALFLPIAWGLLRLRSLARDYPNLPATSALEPLQIAVLQKMNCSRPTWPPPYARRCWPSHNSAAPSNRTATGWLVLGRGYQELITRTAGYRLALNL